MRRSSRIGPLGKEGQQHAILRHPQRQHTTLGPVLVSTLVERGFLALTRGNEFRRRTIALEHVSHK